MIRGSYHNGFAPRDGMPLYPSLWKGCVAAWAPCLGPTGLTLRDWSGFVNHGTLTNMDAGSDWVLSSGQYAVDFDGANDWVSVPDNGLRPTEVTVSAWVNLTAAAANFDAVFTSWGINRGFILTVMNTNAVRMYVRGSVSAYVFAASTSTLVQGVWTHVFGTVSTNSQQVSVGVSGRSQASAAWSASISYGASASAAQIGQYDGNGFGQFLLDDIRVYDRILNANEIQLLASRRGIAYDLAPFRMPYSEQVAGFQAAWALRQRLILGGGGGLG